MPRGTNLRAKADFTSETREAETVGQKIKAPSKREETPL